MADATTPGALRTALDELVERLRANLSLETARLWDGPWHALKDPKRVSLRAPAALVSLAGFDLSLLALRRFAPGQLRAVAAGDPAQRFPAPGQESAPRDDGDVGFPAATSHLRIDLAVTFLASDPAADARAGRTVDLAEAAVPVLLGWRVTDIAGSSLYSPALYEKGLAAFVVMGRRELVLDAPTPERTPPEQVFLVPGEGVPETLYVRGAA